MDLATKLENAPYSEWRKVTQKDLERLDRDELKAVCAVTRHHATCQPPAGTTTPTTELEAIRKLRDMAWDEKDKRSGK